MNHGPPDNLSSTYELVDLGNGRKLEKFGPVHLDRPALAAQNQPRSKSIDWGMADAVFQARQSTANGRWEWKTASRESWQLDLHNVCLRLKPTPVGHIGFFPEHMSHWPWIRSQCVEGLRFLNLFGYTGASTLLLAGLGAEVTHVDSSKSAVQWARHNAEISGLADRPVRWIVEDVLKFVSRERKRGRRYHGFVADPPSYGRGPAGETWKIENDFEPLLDQLQQLVGPSPPLALVTSHTRGFEDRQMARLLKQRFSRRCEYKQGPMLISSKTGKSLASGWFARLHSRE